MKKTLLFILIMILISAVISIYAQFQINYQVANKGVEINCLTNIGVEIKSENQSIVVDAFFHKEFGHLGALDSMQLKEFAQAKPPYSNLDAVLATHFHADHFNLELSLSHLEANNKTILITTFEALEKAKIIDRVMSYSPSVGKDNKFKVKNFSIRAIGTKHFGTPPWSEAQNNAYLITIQGKNILHFGDGAITIENLKYFESIDTIDLAILPVAEMTQPKQRKLIATYLSPKKILAAHIPPQSVDRVKEMLEELYGDELVIFEENKSVILD